MELAIANNCCNTYHYNGTPLNTPAIQYQYYGGVNYIALTLLDNFIACNKATHPIHFASVLNQGTRPRLGRPRGRAG